MILTPGFMKIETFEEKQARLDWRAKREKQAKERAAFEKARLKRKKKGKKK